MNRTPLRKKSKKQAEKDKHWKEITNQKAKDLGLICQWCGRLGSRLSDNYWEHLDGHHIAKRRYNNHNYDNCYLVHRICHRFIEDNNIDVREYTTLVVWDLRNKTEERGLKIE